MGKSLSLDSWASPTFAQMPADSPRTGLMAKITRVSFQPRVNPIIKPPKNVAIAWKSIPILSPIPSLILETSLKEERDCVTHNVRIANTHFFSWAYFCFVKKEYINLCLGSLVCLVLGESVDGGRFSVEDLSLTVFCGPHAPRDTNMGCIRLFTVKFQTTQRFLLRAYGTVLYEHNLEVFMSSMKRGWQTGAPPFFPLLSKDAMGPGRIALSGASQAMLLLYCTPLLGSVLIPPA